MPSTGPRFCPELAAHDPHDRAVVVGHLGDVARDHVLVARRRHLQRRGEVGPQLETVHSPLRIPLRHLLVKNAAPGRHPLHVTRPERPAVAEAVTVLHGAGEHVGDGLDPPMRMPRETREEIGGPVVAEVVEQQERIEVAGIPEPERTPELDARPLDGGRRLDDALDRSDGHHCTSDLKETYSLMNTAACAGVPGAVAACSRGPGAPVAGRGCVPARSTGIIHSSVC
jgi:hypothetical protein